MAQREFPTDARARSEPGLIRNSGPGAPPSHTLPWPGSGPAAFKAPVPVLPNPGRNAWQGGAWLKRFVPPLALFNDASQWVNDLLFVRPLAFGGMDTSNPPLRAQYFTPPPIMVMGGAAGNLNLQLQLGQLSNQAAQLTSAAENYFGKG